jgi:hypothetical protein
MMYRRSIWRSSGARSWIFGVPFIRPRKTLRVTIHLWSQSSSSEEAENHGVES